MAIHLIELTDIKQKGFYLKGLTIMIMTTGDLKRNYKILGIVTVNTDVLMLSSLKEAAQHQYSNVNAIIDIRMFSIRGINGDCIVMYGTAVKTK